MIDFCAFKTRICSLRSDTNFRNQLVLMKAIPGILGSAETPIKEQPYLASHMS